MFTELLQRLFSTFYISDRHDNSRNSIQTTTDEACSSTFISDINVTPECNGACKDMSHDLSSVIDDNKTKEDVKEYSVYIPGSVERLRIKDDQLRVFLGSPEGKTKGMRFKFCKTEKDELKFRREQEVLYQQILNQNIDGKSISANGQVMATEPELPYKSPAVQQLTQFRISIERCQHDIFNQLIEENPRFLVNTSNDLPTLLHIGARYNALHIACRSKNLRAVREVLRLISDLRWLETVYNTDSCMKQRSKNLLDAMLNTPDKICLNTPLHFACKQGTPEIIAELLDQPLCNLNCVNKLVLFKTLPEFYLRYNEKPFDGMRRSMLTNHQKTIK